MNETKKTYTGHDVAFIIPTKDRPEKVKNVLESISSQTMPCGRVIVGFGRIGRRVAALMAPFKVRILVVDPFVQDAQKEFPVLTLEEALPEADIVTLHASGHDGIIAKNEFNLMKPGTFLLNAARGGLVGEDALMESLESRRVSGAWLDTFGQEPYLGTLSRFEQVILTPHIGSYTLECRRSMEMESVENLLDALVSRPE
ncbi:Erythronate-4-phosphate dehydrogenase [subsurface metagenome]